MVGGVEKKLLGFSVSRRRSEVKSVNTSIYKGSVYGSRRDRSRKPRVHGPKSVHGRDRRVFSAMRSFVCGSRFQLIFPPKPNTL